MVSELFGQRPIAGRFMQKMTAENREVWENVPAVLKDQAIKEAEQYLKGTWDPITLALYQEFNKTGDRAHFQNVYFEKRRKLSTLVIAECLEYEGRFIPQIAEGLWALISEPAWVIPAHNVYIRDTPTLPSPLTERPVLDLFVCETGEIIALTLVTLGEVLTARIGKEFVRTLYHQLHTRIILPYLNDHFWWMGGAAGEKLNNWTVWCTQNVLLTSFSMSLPEDERRAVVDKATASLDFWLEQYGEDGCCDEGASYWHAAGLCFWGCLNILDTISGGAASPLFQEQKIRNIGRYIINVHVQGDLYLNFADCSPQAGLLGVREYLFGLATEDTGLIRQALLDWNNDFNIHLLKDKPATSRDPGDNDYNLWYKLLDCLHASEMRAAVIPEEKNPAPFIWYPSTGLAIYRFGGYTLAVKAGCNDDSHNHNDVGSLILYHGEHPMLIDVGVETYTGKTFSPSRYTLWPMQSHYHNVCNFADIMQAAGPEFKATQVLANEQVVEMELKDAYPIESGLKSYRRTIRPTANGITVTETISGSIPPTLTIMTMDRPSALAGEIQFETWSIHYQTDTVAVIEEISIDDPRLRQAWPDKLYRILLPFDGTLTWTIVGK